ncbi:MAG: hypothetical protein IH895_08475 [Planctomycetes bacterium]|nr:hypothetical protein [Planctomycetota bacterium]
MTIVSATPVVFTIAFLLIENRIARRDVEALWAADLVSAAFLAVGWVLIWRGQVVWTVRRLLLTIVAIVASAVPAVLIGLIIKASLRGQDELAVIIGGMCWAVFWLGSTALIWREDRVERQRRLQAVSTGVIHCPNCGYNLTGLEQARCPECGSRYTLNELFAALQEQTEDLDTGEKVT